MTKLKKPDHREYDDISAYLKDMRLYRKKRHPDVYTQGRVAKFCGLGGSQYISNIERGLASPSQEVAIRLAIYYKIERRALYEIFLKMAEKDLAKKFLDKKHKPS